MYLSKAMNTSRSSKFLFYLSFLSLLILTMCHNYDIKHTRQRPTIKYILQWTNPDALPFALMGKGQQCFIEIKCPFTNCYVTGDKQYFNGDYTKFDVIAFFGPEIIRYRNLPEKRSPHQKFLFMSSESSDNYPLCDNHLDGFFNWTWTYKTNSDVMWRYLVIRNSDKKVIGPNSVMHWMDLQDMDPVSDDLKVKLRSKTKAAAWLVSSCHTKSQRESFVKDLKEELSEYSLGVDIYGSCGPLKFPRQNQSDFAKLIERDYYFYLSFENSFSEDYVTEKLLHALKNLAVPVVFGGANYTRFMPDGIYLDGRQLGAKTLAWNMNRLMNNKKQYSEYFRWKNHYSYHLKGDSEDTNDLCRLCSMLNEPTLAKKTTVYENFRDWWMEGTGANCY